MIGVFKAPFLFCYFPIFCPWKGSDLIEIKIPFHASWLYVRKMAEHPFFIFKEESKLDPYLLTCFAPITLCFWDIGFLIKESIESLQEICWWHSNSISIEFLLFYFYFISNLISEEFQIAPETAAFTSN